MCAGSQGSYLIQSLTVNSTGDSMHGLQVHLMFDAYMLNYTMEHRLKLGIPVPTYVTYREVGEF